MHISLDSALGRQRRLNSVGESVLQIAPNAAAAYSLRSLTGGDPKVVRVRRAIDNAESDFTAAGISSGALVNFVNQIQTLGTAVNGTGSFDNYTVSNLSTTGFSADNSAGGTGSAGFPYVFKDDDVIVVRYTVTNFSSTASLSPQIRGVNAISSVTGKTNSGTAFTANGTYTDTLTATADGSHLMYADGNTGSYTISDFEIVSHSSSGFVETWYDQSGNSNDAVQETAGSQPKIVNAGTLLNELDFDGTDDTLAIDFGADLSQANSLFMVHQSDSTSSNSNDFFDRISGSPRTLLDQSGSNYRMLSASSVSTGVAVTTDKSLVFALYNGASSLFAKNGTATSVLNAGTDGINQNSSLGSSGSNFYNGTMQEFIVYNSDQTDNRGALEANIGEAYSITGIPAYDNEVDGFVETWYDQSGNSNNVTQATAGNQPKIVSAGTLVTATNSLPAIDFTSSITRLARAEFLTGQLNSYFNTYQAEAGDSTQAQVVVRQGANYRLVNQVETNGQIRSQIRDSGGSSEVVQAGGDLATGSPVLHTTLIEARGSDGITIFVNGANEVSGDTADIEDTNFATADTGDFAIGAIYNSNSFDFHGKGQEFIFYNSDQSANRVAVETNINSHYSIF